MQRYNSKNSITSIGSSSRVGEKKPLPTHMIIQRENDNRMILLPVTHLVNSSVARVKLNNTATFKTDLNNRKQERGRILQFGNKEECAEQLQVFEMTADIDAYEKTNHDDDEEEKRKAEEQKKDKQSKLQESSKKSSTTPFYDLNRTNTGLNRNISIASSKKQTTNVIKNKENIKSKYLQIDEEHEQNDVSLYKSNELFSCLMEEASSEEDSNNITSKDSFDDNTLSKKNVQRHTTNSIRKGKQQSDPSSKKLSNKDQDENRFISKSQITTGAPSRDIDKHVDCDATTYETVGLDQELNFNDNDVMCCYEVLSKKYDKLVVEHRALQHAHDRLFKEIQLLKRTTMPMPNAACREWIISMGNFFTSKCSKTDIQTHAKALKISNVRDLIDCIENTTTSTARQVVKLLYSSHELETKSGTDIPQEQREAIRAFAESQRGPVSKYEFNEAIDGVFRSAKNAVKKAQQHREESASNNNSKKSSQSINKGQKTLTQMMEKKKVLQSNPNRTILDKENKHGEEIHEDNE
ncbi:unnamed protein product [Rotaria sordida]|uniref:Uncharacterized protein n=1 Tax=Rotaria sordida TaxID=392033 RepID=A0A819RSH6_9BILA|nr:unnamed protein product [Rotaria sordida]